LANLLFAEVIMFEAAEVGSKISKAEFDAEEPQLHTELLAAQRALRETNIPVIIIVSGIEGAGKGAVVNRLNKWLDARGIDTHAFWDESDEERERPSFWRFWRCIPPRGTIGIMFGSWYTQPIISHVFGREDTGEFDRHLKRIEEFERMLTKDGALIIKFWFHMSKKAQKKQLEMEAGDKDKRHSPLLKKFSKHYDAFASASEHAIRVTDQGACPWYLVEAVDSRYRDLTVGRVLLQALKKRLDDHNYAASATRDEVRIPSSPTAEITILDHIDLEQTASDKQYKRQLAKYQHKYYQLTWAAKQKKRSSIIVLEGWDAAGKGGAIRRLTGAMDARLYKVISVAAPTDEEKAHHYLWRFWRHLPRAGYVTIYDRSWYGRVLVERVEKFAREDEWRRAYQEINDFEEQLLVHGIILTKFWIHLSKEEQLRRFKEREKTPWKLHKITEEDWRNREKWDDYKAAVNDMVSHTSTEYAPWKLVPGNDKKVARLEILKTCCRNIEATLAL
jgi:polyphosphate:AMP phosphotransferase